MSSVTQRSLHLLFTYQKTNPFRIRHSKSKDEGGEAKLYTLDMMA